MLTLDVDFDGMAIMKAIDQESVEVEINHHQLKFKEEERVITKVWIIPRNVNFKGIGAKMPSSGSERSHTSDRLRHTNSSSNVTRCWYVAYYAGS